MIFQNLLKAYKRKAYLSLPHKHSSLSYAHSRYQEISSSFIRLLRHRLSVSDLSVSSVLPGQILEERYEILVPLPHNTVHLWRQIISSTYSKVVMEPSNTSNIISNSVIERRNSVATCSLVRELERSSKYQIPAGIKEGVTNFDVDEKKPVKTSAAGRSVSYVVFWKCSEDFGEEIFKISLTIYQKGILQVLFHIFYHLNQQLYDQVKGVSYLLWMLDCYPSLSRMVNMIKMHQDGQTFEKKPTMKTTDKRRDRRKSL